MYSQPVVVIGPDNCFTNTLKQALARLFNNVDISHGVLLVKSEDTALAIAVIDNNNVRDIEALSHDVSMIVVKPNNVDIDHSAFEKIFETPLRLGQLVEYARKLIAQKEQHKKLAPIRFGDDIFFDPRTYFLNHKTDKKHILLTKKEAEIILFLSKNVDKSVSRQDMLDEVWGYASTVETHTLETHIYRLRQKLKNEFGLDDFLVTNDEGYILNF